MMHGQKNIKLWEIVISHSLVNSTSSNSKSYNRQLSSCSECWCSVSKPKPW